jgi:hypothetical protein
MNKLIQKFINNRFDFRYKISKQWFIGFIEAEGHFAGKNIGDQPFFTISQHSADKNLILAIRNFIGHGNIREYVRSDGRSETILTIYSKDVLRNIIIPMCINNFRSEKKINQFNNWLIKFFPDLNNIQLKDNLINPQWLAGFVDGDGSFYSVLHKAKDYKCGFQTQVIFDIAQLDSEQKLLKNIGISYFNNEFKWAKSKDTQHLRITKIKTLKDYVIPIFDNNTLQSRKYIDYIIWKEIISLMDMKKHLTLSGIEQIKELRNLQNYYRSN